MGFDPYNRFLKIWESIRSSLGSVGVHFLTFSHTFESMKCDSQPSQLARTFASPCLGCKPKARVTTQMIFFKL